MLAHSFEQAACCVISWDRNAKRSFMELGGIRNSWLRHPPGKHGLTRAIGLGSEYRFTLGHKADMLIDRLSLGISRPFGSDDLRFREG